VVASSPDDPPGRPGTESSVTVEKQHGPGAIHLRHTGIIARRPVGSKAPWWTAPQVTDT
jgi:hypothetical protein